MINSHSPFPLTNSFVPHWVIICSIEIDDKFVMFCLQHRGRHRLHQEPVIPKIIPIVWSIRCEIKSNINIHFNTSVYYICRNNYIAHNLKIQSGTGVPQLLIPLIYYFQNYNNLWGNEGIIKNKPWELSFSRLLAGAEGLEPSTTVLETGMLALHYAPIKFIWWAFRDSNPKPTGYEPVALTNWAKGPCFLRRLGAFIKRPAVLAPPVGLEPTTLRLTAACSANWAKEE